MLLLRSFIGAVLPATLCVGCSTKVPGAGIEQPGTADAGDVGDAGVVEVVDAADLEVQFDAVPQILPCIEGDSQVSDPSDETCYMLFDTPRSWDAAQIDCQLIGATLAIVDNEAEQQIVAGLSTNFPSGAPDVWIGATDGLVEDSFVWVDDQPMVFESWRLGEPNNAGPTGEEDCVVIEGDTPANEWDDRSCDRAAPYICER